jgi:hypothetical protein
LNRPLGCSNIPGVPARSLARKRLKAESTEYVRRDRSQAAHRKQTAPGTIRRRFIWRGSAAATWDSFLPLFEIGGRFVSDPILGVRFGFEISDILCDRIWVFSAGLYALRGLAFARVYWGHDTRICAVRPRPQGPFWGRLIQTGPLPDRRASGLRRQVFRAMARRLRS